MNVDRDKYIYESPDDGITVYRREVGKDDRECIKDNKNRCILELLCDIQSKIDKIKELL